VDALYSKNDSVHIDTLIKYEDGRQAHIVTDMRIIPITE
jgi:long-chain acyl-CoA synthetase